MTDLERIENLVKSAASTLRYATEIQRKGDTLLAKELDYLDDALSDLNRAAPMLEDFLNKNWREDV